jgi:hypothetical protein
MVEQSVKDGFLASKAPHQDNPYFPTTIFSTITSNYHVDGSSLDSHGSVDLLCPLNILPDPLLSHGQALSQRPILACHRVAPGVMRDQP